jgi:hypothetical protein
MITLGPWRHHILIKWWGEFFLHFLSLLYFWAQALIKPITTSQYSFDFFIRPSLHPYHARCLMFNLGHTISFTVKVIERCTQGYNGTEIHGHTTVSFMEGEGLPNLWVAHHPSAWSSALLSMNWCRPVILSVANCCWPVFIECLLYQELMLELVLMFEFAVTTEHEWAMDMQVDLNMQILHWGLSSKLKV